MARATSDRWTAIRPAAYRYTEARLEALAEHLMDDLDQDTVDYVPNFDETTTEPTVLPAPYPNLLVNGSTGIAVGMATNIPPHNLAEVVDGVIWVIENTLLNPPEGAKLTRDQQLKELIRLIPGPDFPTGGVIVGRRGHSRGVRHRPRRDPAARDGGNRDDEEG